MVNPYPTNGSKGDVVMAENAATVVMLVKKMGIRSESIVDATAFFVSLNALNSLKNFVITWTPSEFAMVNKMMGMDVFASVNKNLFDPVKRSIQPIKPIMAAKDNMITVITIPTAGTLRKFNNNIVTIMIIPVSIRPLTSSRIIGGIIPVK